MIWRPALAITVVAVADLLLLLEIGSLIGLVPTALWMLIAGLCGAWLAKREGLHLLTELAEEVRQGLPPAGRLVEGGMIVLGALLLIFPGVLTDLAGLVLVLGPSRRWLAPRVLKSLTARFDVPASLGPEPDDPVRIRRPKPVPTQDPPARPAHPFASPFDDLP